MFWPRDYNAECIDIVVGNFWYQLQEKWHPPLPNDKLIYTQTLDISTIFHPKSNRFQQILKLYCLNQQNQQS